MNNTDRINEINISNEGCKMKIIKYNGVRNVVIEFQDKYKAKIHTTYEKFKKGSIKNPYYPSVCGVGYFGQGKYKSRGKDKKKTIAYQIWNGMIKRCYDAYELNKEPTYIDCYVCDEWLCFQNFAEWFYENYYECDNERIQLDKDILIKGNKIYSPKTCVFVPQRINELFTKSDSIRGEYPIGVSYHKATNKLMARCSVLENNKKKRKHLGLFELNQVKEAFTCYKQFKENYIKQVAEEYKEFIPIELYNAMYNYQIEIND